MVAHALRMFRIFRFSRANVAVRVRRRPWFMRIDSFEKLMDLTVSERSLFGGIRSANFRVDLSNDT